MDDADLADVRIRSMIESAREEAAHQLTKMAVATGHCLNCGEDLDDGRRFCDKDCADDWHKRNMRR